MFVELLGRSCFSFLRASSQPHELVSQAETLGLTGFALCDLDGIYGAVRAWKANEKNKLKYIVGSELTLATAHSSPGHIAPLPQEGTALSVALLVQNQQGYQTLCRLLTRAHKGQEKGKCVSEVEWFTEEYQGLFALLVAPDDPRQLSGREDIPQLLAAAFGSHFAIATYRHQNGLDRLRQQWVEQIATHTGAPIVASARPLYHSSIRKPLLDVLSCIRQGITLDEAGTRLSINAQQQLRSEEEMRKLFRSHPEWVSRSHDIAQSCSFDFSQLTYHFPCQLEPGQDANERLAELTWEGVGRRYPGGISADLRAQLNKELRLIKKINVAPYFLSTYDIVEIARKKRILCQGRGSAANSAVCYMLGITAVDPSRSQLLFERFLSEERAEPPDIDIDFEHERREEVIREIYQRHGRDRAAMVSEVISYRGKSALREVSRVFGLSEEQASRLSGTIVWQQPSEQHEQRLLEAGFDLSDARVRQVVAIAEQLRGFPRHLSIHVGGFVLSSRPLYEVAPVEPAKMEGRTVIPWDKDDIDDLGFFKVDVLALGMLTAIRKALELISQSGGLPRTATVLAGTAQLGGPATSSEFDPLEAITRIPAEDPKTYQMVSRGDTVGVFQIESRAQMAMLPRLRPERFYDLVIEVAIVRPGPIQGGMVHPFLRRRNNEEKITCPHPDLWPILERTLGVPLFQEQVMQIAIVGAGYSAGEADQLRRDMAAWKKHGRLMSHRKRLLSGFNKKGISQEFGHALFEQIKGFGEYGFPESHASSFALLVYASSWQKRHYPAHFTCALLNSQPMGFYQPTSLLRDAQSHGVVVRDVCILKSERDCTLEALAPDEESPRNTSYEGSGRALRLGFRLIKGLGKATVQKIIAQRKQNHFSSLEDLLRRVRPRKHEIEALAESGALDSLSTTRRQALWKARAPHTGGLFQNTDVAEAAVTLPSLTPAEQLVLDYQRKGLSVSDHPLRHHRKRLKKMGAIVAEDLFYLPKGSRVAVAGLVLARQRPATASGVVFVTLEDETGVVNLIVYSQTFEKYHHVARHSQMLFVVGKIERDTRLPVASKPQKSPDRSTCTRLAPHPALLTPEGQQVPVIHLIVEHIERFGPSAQPYSDQSRNFH